jgi:hypothetical protein
MGTRTLLVDIGMGTMTNDVSDSQPNGAWPQLQSAPLIAGGVLIGVGALVAIAGMAVAGVHVISATRAWIKELETPPSQLARLRWEQAKSAAASGASTWRAHPNAQTRLTRRASSSSSE